MEGHLGGTPCHSVKHDFLSVLSVIKKGIQSQPRTHALLHVSAPWWEVHPDTEISFSPCGPPNLGALVLKYRQDTGPSALGRQTSRKSTLCALHLCAGSAGQQPRRAWAQPSQRHQTRVTCSTQPQLQLWARGLVARISPKLIQRS